MYNYKWFLKDGFTKSNGCKVFSCFAGGGGSSMGYKLAGYEVIGINEIDKKMSEAYLSNFTPKYPFVEPIQDFKNRTDLPDELFDLDILDGSPPCSTFSMAGGREEDWGKEKKFREGQAEQVLDTLFFDFIDLAKKLQPKVVLGENVKGMLFGKAREYVNRIVFAFEDAGYYISFRVVNGIHYGLPQTRERIIFTAVRKDLIDFIETQPNLFVIQPYLDLFMQFEPVRFREISDEEDTSEKITPLMDSYYDKCEPGETFSKYHPKGSFFNTKRLSYDKVVPTICAHPTFYHPKYKRLLNTKELALISSFPLDYNYCNVNPAYIMGMSVPPIMIAYIAEAIYKQWLVPIINKKGN
jgi:DNA (cytosine-5)-methyltransferase 1